MQEPLLAEGGILEAQAEHSVAETLVVQPLDDPEASTEDSVAALPAAGATSKSPRRNSTGARASFDTEMADAGSGKSASLATTVARANALWLFKFVVPFYAVVVCVSLGALYATEQADNEDLFNRSDMLLIKRARYGPVPTVALFLLVFGIYKWMLRDDAPRLQRLRAGDRFGANRAAFKYTLSLTDNFILARAPSPRALRRPWRLVDHFVVGQAAMGGAFLVYLGARELFTVTVSEGGLIGYYIGVRVILRLFCMPVKYYCQRFYGSNSALSRVFHLSVDHGVGSTLAPMMIFVLQMLVTSVNTVEDDGEMDELIATVGDGVRGTVVWVVVVEEFLLWCPVWYHWYQCKRSNLVVPPAPPAFDSDGEMRHLAFTMAFPLVVEVMVPDGALVGCALVLCVCAMHYLRLGYVCTRDHCARLWMHHLPALLYTSAYYMALGSFAVSCVPATTPAKQSYLETQAPDAKAYLMFVWQAVLVAYFARYHRAPFGDFAGTEPTASLRQVAETQYYLHMVTCPDWLAAGTTFFPRMSKQLSHRSRMLRAVGGYLLMVVMLVVTLGMISLVHLGMEGLATATAGKACFANKRDSWDACINGKLSLWYLWIGYPIALSLIAGLCFPVGAFVASVRDARFSHTASIDTDPALMMRIPRQPLIDELKAGSTLPEGSLPAFKHARHRMVRHPLGKQLDDKLGRASGPRTLLFNFLFRNRLVVIELWNQHPFLGAM